MTIKQVTYTVDDSDHLWGINELQKQESQNAVNVGTSNGDLKEIHVTDGRNVIRFFQGFLKLCSHTFGETDTTFMIEQSHLIINKEQHLLDEENW